MRVSAPPRSQPAWSTPATTSSTRRSASCSSPQPTAGSAGSPTGVEPAEEELARIFGRRVLRAPLDYVRRELDEYFAGRRQDFDLPLDLRVAPFNEQVLHELARVPYGRTETYGGLAAKVGHPRAARAVGTVMNRNPIAIVLPCHRIVGANGSLTGYAGGLDRKRALLELEGATLPCRSAAHNPSVMPPNDESQNTPHVVVVGGGFGGLQAVRGLRRAQVRVTLVDRQNFHLFQPLAYQVATGALSAVEIATPLRQILRRQKNAHVVLAEVTGFDLERARRRARRAAERRRAAPTFPTTCSSWPAGRRTRTSATTTGRRLRPS